MQRYCQALDLQPDPALIAQYRQHHARIWPQVRDHLRACGLLEMEIYLLGTRLFMIMEVDDSFSFAAMAEADRHNPKVREWEQLMDTFQQRLPGTPPEQKWIRMERIFQLTSQ